MSLTLGSEANAHGYLEVNKKSWDSRAAAVLPSKAAQARFQPLLTPTTAGSKQRIPRQRSSI